MRKKKVSLLVKIIIAILLGIAFSFFFPNWLTQIFVTFNSLFGNFLNFIIPLLILGLVAPGIAELGKGAGKMLGVTAAIAYASTVIAGLFSYFTCRWSYPHILNPEGFSFDAAMSSTTSLAPYFTVEMPPLFGVMSALILAFVLGLTLAVIEGKYLRNALFELREVIMIIIKKVIIPLLPIYIFGIFLKMGAEGAVGSVMTVFLKVIIVIFAMHIIWLVLQFVVAGMIAGKNPFVSLKNMFPAYMTALGTQSSAATIPVTLAQAKKNGVRDEIGDFVIPLCATIHLSGSTLKIVACAFAVSFMLGNSLDLGLYLKFIMMLGITMVAAPGVPGGAIMAALGVLSSILGFTDEMNALMIALYIAMDSFGTACNVTGDGAIAMIVNKLFKKDKSEEPIVA